MLSLSAHVKSPDVYVFLRQEVERRQGEVPLLSAVIDALILWGLEGTDPDQGILLGREQIRQRIEEAVPSAHQLLTAERLDGRLEQMARKDYQDGRAIRWHQKEDKFCLPFETRSFLEEENRQDTALQIAAKDGFAARIAEAFGDRLDIQRMACATEVCLVTIRRSFEREGLLFSHFLSRKEPSPRITTMTDTVREILEERGVDSAARPLISEAVIHALRSAFYASTEAERLYLSTLSRTYALLFTLNTEPRLIEYFQEMTGNFTLYVGSDIIVQALSERYLALEDQMTRNMLRMAVEAGATLVLAEPVLDEVLNHLRTSDTDFQTRFKRSQDYLTTEITRNSARILIRAYFYAKLQPDRHVGFPTSWEKYINQFCGYGLLHKREGRTSVRDYLQAQFRLTFESRDEMRKSINREECRLLTEAFMTVKRSAVLAGNDALMTLAVYSRRKERGEGSQASEFGYKIWWLTGESAIVSLASKTVQKHDGQRFMMRPEFLLNFIGLAPSTAQVRETFRKVFPSLLGIRLAHRMNDEPFANLLRKVDEAMELEEGRRQAAIAGLIDHLRGDFGKEYARHL
jgi:hypothetical protein